MHTYMHTYINAYTHTGTQHYIHTYTMLAYPHHYCNTQNHIKHDTAKHHDHHAQPQHPNSTTSHLRAHLLILSCRRAILRRVPPILRVAAQHPWAVLPTPHLRRGRFRQSAPRNRLGSALAYVQPLFPWRCVFAEACVEGRVYVA